MDIIVMGSEYRILALGGSTGQEDAVEGCQTLSVYVWTTGKTTNKGSAKHLGFYGKRAWPQKAFTGGWWTVCGEHARSEKIVYKWVEGWKNSGISTEKRNSSGRNPTVTTPTNTARV